jgi:hypothetical protein
MIFSKRSEYSPYVGRALALAAAAIVVATILPGAHARAEGASCAADKKHTCEELVQDNILWRVSSPDSPASKHWAQENLDALCACTTDAYATVNCFQVQVNNNHKTWQDAIAICRAKP